MIDLNVRRSAAELLDATFAVFRQRWHVFLALTFLVVAPVVVLVDGVWGDQLRDGFDATPSPAQRVVSFALTAIVVPATVTALHCVVVAALAAGRRPGLGAALSDVAPHLVRAIGVVCLYMLAVIAGLILLVVPGIWIAIRWHFGAQAAVLEGRNPGPALERSADLVEGAWWRVFGLLVLIGLLGGIVALPLQGIGAIRADGALLVTGQVLGKTLTLSLGAIFSTLLFFDLATRRAAPLTAAAHPVAPTHPEAPAWANTTGYAPPGFEPPRPPEPFGPPEPAGPPGPPVQPNPFGE